MEYIARKLYDVGIRVSLESIQHAVNSMQAPPQEVRAADFPARKRCTGCLSIFHTISFAPQVPRAQAQHSTPEQNYWENGSNSNGVNGAQNEHMVKQTGLYSLCLS